MSNESRFVPSGSESDRPIPVPLWSRTALATWPALRVGRVDLEPDDPRFRFSGVPGAPLVLFPTTFFQLQRMGGERFLVDPMMAVLLDRDGIYYRYQTSGEGDRSLWLEQVDSGPAHQAPAPAWPTLLAPITSSTYLLQWALDDLLRTVEAGRLEPDDADWGLVHSAGRRLWAEAASSARRARERQETDGAAAADSSTGERIVERFRVALETWHRRADPLTGLLRELGVSKTHLNRLLRGRLGLSPHRYRLELRVRRALLLLEEGPASLAEIAAQLGFSSHSHLTLRFHQIFGVVPSWVRSGAPRDRLRFLLER